MEQTELLDWQDVSFTLLATLYSRAHESRSKDPIFTDPQSEEIVRQLTPLLAQSPNKLHQNLAKGKVDKNLVVHIALRAKRYDAYTRSFLQQAPDGVVINIGAGLDTRFQRIDNGQVQFYDLDFPEVIDLKRKLLNERDRYRFIPSSVLDFAWMDQVAAFKDRPFLFLAEGVFMYLREEEVKLLVLALQANFPGCELVCEVVNAVWLWPSLKWMIDMKLQREMQFGKGVTYHFGIHDGQELESWHEGIEFLDEWSYFDAPEKKLGMLKLFRHIPLLRKTQWTVHYRLN